jgi:hypothetical protein
MESMTMTNATRVFRDRFACPLTDGALPVMDAAAAQGKGTTVPAFGLGIDGGIGRGIATSDRSVVTTHVPAYQPLTTDVARSRTWRPPV